MTTLPIIEYYNHAQATKHLREYNPDLDVDMMRQPGLFAYYSSQLAKAETQWENLKNKASVIEAKLALNFRSAAAAKGDKITESIVTSNITTDSRMMAIQDAILRAKEQVSMLKGVCEGLRQRRDVLMQLAFLAREERKGGMSVMGKSAEENQRERIKRLESLEPIVVIDD